MKNQILSSINGGVRRMQRLFCFGLLCLGLVGAARAADALYQNDYPVLYVDNAPIIHATNFVNNAGSLIYGSGSGNAFEVDFAISSIFTFYETWDTINYTNNGVMITDTGFKFDTQVTNQFGNTVHRMAGSFYNPGIISCASEFSTYFSSYALALPGQLIVNATNISMPGGTVIVGTGGSTTPGLISFVGQNVDLSSSTITLESASSGSMGSVSAIPNSGSLYYAGFGSNTNADWDPSNSLTSVSAQPSQVRMGNVNPALWEYAFGDGSPFPTASQLPLATTPYAYETQVRTNSFIYQYVFVANSDPSTTFNVYIPPNPGNRAGQDTITVEFVGSYVDTATGLPHNNYLYVTDDYLQGAANNVGFSTVTGIPANFTMTVSGTQLTPAGTNVPPNFNFHPFIPGAITNNYSYVDAECVPTSVLPTPVSLYTNNYLAILPGKILINASGSLDLSGAEITGQNYISVTATNLIMGSPGSTSISSPYADLNIGVATGSLLATNLVRSAVPAWSGYAQAWSTRWIDFVTNTIITYTNGNVPIATNSYPVTNDFRVAIIANQASPTSPTAVWDVALHSSNNIVISDVYNILDGLNLDSVGLTLTTNGLGAQSPAGVLNLQGTTVNWAAATPNLRYLTNYGDIYLPLTGPPSIGIFGTAAAPYGALLNYGLIEDSGSQVWADNFMNSGIFHNNVGSFILNSRTATLAGGNSGGYLLAAGDVSITTGSLIASNAYIEADRSLTITATDQLTDGGVGNGAIWYVGYGSVGNGIKMLAAPAGGGGGYGNSLLGTMIELFAPTNRVVQNVWAGTDYGATPAGFTNNLAVGVLYLDSLGLTNNTRFVFSGAGAGNALYVDYLQLVGGAAVRDGNGNLAAVNINSNLVIYYAQAVANGVSIAQKLDGKNNGHLRWVPTYAGYYSSTNILFNGVLYSYNAALAQSSSIDSNGNGIPNSADSSPFFLPGMINPVVIYPTNNPPNTMAISWNSIPLATNYLFYSTNMSGPFTNLVLPPFVSPIPYPSPTPTNVMVLDPVTSPPRFYLPMVSPWLTYPN